MAIDSFIDRNNDMQVKWIENYLRNQSYNIQESLRMEIYEYIERGRVSAIRSADLELLITKMRGAWRQKIYRDNQKSNGKRACSFTLSNRSLRHLNKLAKDIGAPINSTLEEIIEDTYLRNKEMQQISRKPKQKKIP